MQFLLQCGWMKTTLDAGDSEKREGTFSYNAFGKEGSADGTTLVTSGESTGIGFIPPEKAPGMRLNHQKVH